MLACEHVWAGRTKRSHPIGEMFVADQFYHEGGTGRGAFALRSTSRGTGSPTDGSQRPASLMQVAASVERMVSRETMTIQIPDDLARDLEGIAAAQQKSVEQVALDSLRSLFDTASSPEVVLRAVRELSHPSAAAVDDLEAAIASARLPVRDQDTFDRWPPG